MESAGRSHNKDRMPASDENNEADPNLPDAVPAFNQHSTERAATSRSSKSSFLTERDLNGGEEELPEIPDGLSAEYKHKHRNVVIQACNLDEMTDDDFPDKNMDCKKNEKEVAEIIKQINSLVLFQGYEDKELMSVISFMYKRKVAKGEVVIRQGDDGDAFYVIRSGKYECMVNQNGKNETIHLYDGSGYFGDLALIHNAPRAATIIAASNGELWVLNALRYVWLKKKQAVHNAERFEQVIRQIPMFSKNLTNALVSRLIDAIEVITLHKGDAICRQGEPGDAMFFIMDGSVSVSVNNSEVCIMNANGFFGERALILDEPRAATCSAKTDVKLAKLPKESFGLIIPDAVVLSMREYVSKAYSNSKSKSSIGKASTVSKSTSVSQQKK